MWGLHNTGQTGGTSDADIDAPEAWDISTGSVSVVIAVVDSGVDYTHPDLDANIWVNTGETSCTDGIDNDGNGYIDDCRGWDFVNNDNNPMDDNDHGTHVSGTIAAEGNNGIGVTGVNWTAKIMPLKFLNKKGSGTTADAIEAILYANANGAHVINNSWGGGAFSQALKDAIDASPAVVVCAAGNDGVDNDATPHYPSSYTSVNLLSVAATDDTDILATFSNYGVTSVDLGAPGVSIYSTIPKGTYASYSGTSMASPHVSGVAGLVKALNPGFTNLDIKNSILNSVDPKSSLSGKVATGGRLNAYNALTGAVAEPDISATPASKDFGSVNVGDSSGFTAFTISNDGTANLVIGSVYLTGANPGEFSFLYEQCSGKTLSPSGTCLIDVVFSPTQAGALSASIAIPSNDPSTPTLEVPLSGTGIKTLIADPGGPYTGIEGQLITLDGSGSTDSVGTITLYEWDIDNDGTFDYSSASPIQNHTYAQQGIYTVNLRVTNDLGTTDEATTTATVSDTLPTADFTGSPTSGLAPLAVNFTDNSTGYDQPLSYEWDFDNDGLIDSTVQNPSYTYNTTGIYTVSLTATDSDGSANSLTRTDYITVDACPEPVRISGATPVYYSTLQAAYDAAVDGDVIQSRAIVFTANLNINLDKSVTLQGGYDCNYATVTGVTTINGTMTVSDGTVTVENFVVE